MVERPALRVMNEEDADAAIDTIVAGFLVDPLARWMYPTAHQYLRNAVDNTSALVGSALPLGSACVTDNCAGVAVWLPPGFTSDAEPQQETISNATLGSVADDLQVLTQQLAESHPSVPHWYLPVIGVDPFYQGLGYGDALMRFALERIDNDPAPAYLESSSPRSVPLYVRHGFTPLGEVQVGKSPPIVPMLRAAR